MLCLRSRLMESHLSQARHIAVRARQVSFKDQVFQSSLSVRQTKHLSVPLNPSAIANRHVLWSRLVEFSD